ECDVPTAPHLAGRGRLQAPRWAMGDPDPGLRTLHRAAGLKGSVGKAGAARFPDGAVCLRDRRILGAQARAVLQRDGQRLLQGQEIASRARSEGRSRNHEATKNTKGEWKSGGAREARLREKGCGG